MPSSLVYIWNTDVVPGYDRISGYIEKVATEKDLELTSVLECADSCSDVILCTAFTFECWQFHNSIAEGHETADDGTFYAASYFKRK